MEVGLRLCCSILLRKSINIGHRKGSLREHNLSGPKRHGDGERPGVQVREIREAGFEVADVLVPILSRGLRVKRMAGRTRVA